MDVLPLIYKLICAYFIKKRASVITRVPEPRCGSGRMHKISKVINTNKIPKNDLVGARC